MKQFKILRKFSICLLVSQFLATSVFAQIPGLEVSGIGNANGAEYFVGRIEGKPLITVNLVGGVKHPGVYHIPIQTDLTQLFSYAGGVLDNSDISEVIVRRQKLDLKTTQIVNIENSMKSNKDIPIIMDRDTVLVPTKRDTLTNTAIWVGVLSGIATLALTVITISNTTR